MATQAPAPPKPEFALRIAVMNLACAPQAQRRYVQLGMLQRACATIDELAPRIDELSFSSEQKEQIRELASQLERLRSSSSDFMHLSESGTRAFLYGTALEEPEWSGVRTVARRLFTQLRDQPAPAGVEED
jgi:hypothetical protein